MILNWAICPGRHMSGTICLGLHLSGSTFVRVGSMALPLGSVDVMLGKAKAGPTIHTRLGGPYVRLGLALLF